MLMIRNSALLLLLPAAAFCADNQLTPAERKSGWQLLFDGRSLEGWRLSPGSDAFSVDSGLLKSSRKPKVREDMLTTAEFGDFELLFDWRISPRGNSGVKYRLQDIAVIHPSLVPESISKFERKVDYALQHPTPRERMPQDGKGEAYTVAFEYQVIDNRSNADALHSPKSLAGALYQMAPPSQDATKPVGEWNQGRIVARGSHVEHWLNGTKVVDASLDDAQVREGIQARWTAESPVFRLLTQRPRKRGPIIIQNHGDEAWFRNLKIKSLDR